ncbi:hypothetical protein RBB68_10245 [Leptospira interrogans]|uniref:Uncharacterized protein n=1 Tax=Leptospira interrogans serovar Icterohaemorrhagiae TaxID=90062 RepID=A0AAW4K0K9_LEPIR|nr:hypothetical protein [Leptospira interrogans]ARB94806.1 hypothetical protein A6J42_03830 [Leptospira interrogans serovar Copenhageni]KAA5548545.1 hypothetical protein F3G11_17270 [Leptospira interrogans serovar Copenhageni]MBO7988374.1 hypothetical protein [Leptospira interrogans serovar Copenhageni]MBO7992028.1 hypothetical protein [Leptospira interrogans serovar Copenhageni]MBO7995624.1 hypothetical protein [Leptospira interrogans serovar Copenhageni]
MQLKNKKTLVSITNVWRFSNRIKKYDIFLVRVSQKNHFFRNAVATIDLIFFIVEKKLLKNDVINFNKTK